MFVPSDLSDDSYGIRRDCGLVRLAFKRILPMLCAMNAALLDVPLTFGYQ